MLFRSLDADGWLDAVAVLDGKPTLFSPKPNSNRYLTYRIKGISDPNGGGRNNQYAVGSTVELFGPFGYQARVIEDDSVHFGLGTNEAYYLRNIFVNGLTQGIIDPKPNHILEEKQVLIGSCPFLYGWNGSRWEMITDLLWNAPLGLQIAKGKVLPDRRWEYLSLPRDLMKPHRGAIELRITEELWETAYFDHVALLTIDHPAETEWYSNEKVGPESIAKPILWGYRSTIKPTSVKDQKGRDWTAAVEHADGSYAIPFDKQIKQGLIEPTYLELDFGKITSSKPSQLILTGWIYPTDTSLNIAIDQNDNLEPPAPLSLWVVGKSGEFEQVIPFTGFPGGKPKTIVVPLDLLFKTNDHRIRLMHSSQIYWDQIRLGYGEPIGIGSPFDAEDYKAVDIESRKSSLLFSIGQLRLESADLHYRGFSRELPRTRHEPHWYEYSDVSTFPAWPPLRGNFTQFGSVTPLIQTNDDILVVMGSGDEMILRFQLPETDPPEGWVRDYILHSVGWDKDAAMNTLEGQSSLPLPFSRMSQYPPGFDDRDAALIVNRDHERTLTRKQPAKNFWNLSPSQLKTPTATNSQTKSQ